MPQLPRFTAKELIKIIQHLGFEFDRQKGSHMTFKHPDGRITVIPNHPGEELGPGLLNKIIKEELKITREEFMKLI
ncbi:MAG: type II toxin-antitoxin system HicA family toxin [Candidatus Nanoarchaeia archaeon]